MSWDDGVLSRFTVAAPVIDLDACYVYVAWGEDLTRPLYVGKSREPIGRIGRHLREALWCYDVRSFDFYAFATEGAALDAEGRAIFELNPVHNVVRGNPGGAKTREVRARRRVRFAKVAFPKPIRGITPSQLGIVAGVQARRGRAEQEEPW